MSLSAPPVEKSLDSTVDRDQVHDLLSNHRRRFALHALKNVDGTVELSDLAEQVAAWENNKTVETITSTERHRVYTSMQQSHLPAMERAGIIECDNGTVKPSPKLERLDVYLDIVPEESISWAQYYLGLSVLAVLLVGVGWMGLFPTGVSGLMVAGLVAGLFLISSVYHVWQNRGMRLGAREKPPEIET